MSDQGIRIATVGPTAYGIISTLYAECFDDEWSAAAIERVLEPAGSFALLARRGPRSLGFLLCRLILDEAEILSIGVHPDRRRHGVGKLLLAAERARAKAHGSRWMFLEVAEDNAPARALYGALEFEQTGWRPGYYPRPEGQSVSALLMSLRLDA